MTHPSEQPVDDQTPPSAAEQVQEREPHSEAERQAQETVRSVSRLEESN